MDVMPEIMNGKNVADFIDPDIAEKLEALEREEERLQAEGFYDNDEDIVSTFFRIFLLYLSYRSLSLTPMMSARPSRRGPTLPTKSRLKASKSPRRTSPACRGQLGYGHSRSSAAK